MHNAPAAHGLWLLLGNDCNNVRACRASGGRCWLHRAHHGELHRGRMSTDRRGPLAKKTETTLVGVSAEVDWDRLAAGKEDRVPMTALHAPGALSAEDSMSQQTQADWVR